jgi:7-cyano-7-deazaguanine synthase
MNFLDEHLDTCKRSILLLSGGLDSAVLLYHLKSCNIVVQTLSINYNQRHCKELEAARVIALSSGVIHRVADISAISPLLAGSALTSDTISVPLGHYEDDTMKITVVPNRNMILLSIATGWAISTGFDSVAYAAHSGDHAIYPDCRAEFTDAMDTAMALCDWQPIKLIRPFVKWTKADIVRRGQELNVPMELTWSCYQGNDIHCGQCGTCVERREAFVLAGINDLTQYLSSD